MALGRNHEFDYISELKNLIEDQTNRDSTEKKKSAAKFQSESLEKRELYSASWIDADAADEAADVDEEHSEPETLSADGKNLFAGLEGNAEADLGLSLSRSSVDENSPTGTVVGTLSASDSDSPGNLKYEIVDDNGKPAKDANFKITGDEIRVSSKANLDFEQQSSHDLKIRVTDSEGSSQTETFTIDVNDVDDTIYGTENRDILRGTGDDDVMMGLGGNDYLLGGDGDDEMYGNDGLDYLLGGAGNDELIGGAGTDYLYGGDGADVLDGGEGTDWAFFYDSKEGIEANLNDGTVSGGNADGDQLIDIEGIAGTTHDDVLTGDENDNLLYGYSGDDVIAGGDGDDILYDYVGSNEISGDDGDDRIYIGGTDNTVDAGDGDDYVYTYSGDADIDGGKGNDTIFGAYTRGNLDVDAGDGDDSIRSGRGDDRIEGGAGDDTIDGGLGDDVAVYSGNWADYDVTDNGDGTNTISDSRGIDGTDTVSNVQSFEFADGTVDVADLLNEAPDGLKIGNSSIAENSTPGTVVGTLSASDANALDSHTYEIVDSGGNVVADPNFEIIGDEVRVKAGADLNYEATSSYDLNIRVTDAGGESHTESFTIDVSDVNEGPTVSGESYTTSEDRPVTGNLLANDTDVDGDALTVGSYTQPAHGDVTVDANGDSTYQPNANFSGSDSFTYTVSDGNGGTATETVSIDVSAVADQADLDVNDATGDEDTAIALDVSTLLVDTDGSESISDVTISGVPSGAVLSGGTDNGDGSWSLAPGNLDGLTVTPDANSNADFDLTVEVTTVDGADSATISDSIHVEVNAVNDAVNDIDLSGTLVAENSPAGTIVGTLSASDIDAGESFTYEIVDAGGNVVADANFEIVGDEVRVKAGAELNFEVESSHDLNIRVTDAGGESHTESFTIDVTDVDETIYGTENRDVLRGTADDDVIRALGGDDHILAGDGNDEVHGDGGNDYLLGQAGDDHLMGGAGNDYLYGGDGQDVLDGGDGNDWALFYDSDEGIEADLNQGTISGGNADGDTLISVEGIGGTTHDDILTGDDNANLLYGNSGDDKLTGGGGDDLLYDIAGENEFLGGEGNDRIYVGGIDNTVDSGEGNDTVYVYSGEADIDSGDGNDTIVGAYSTGALNVDAGDGNDAVFGGRANDQIAAGDGDDSVRSGRGDDRIEGGAGDDTIDGGLGDDVAVYSGNWADYDVTDNSDGTYTISDSRGIDGTDTVSSVQSFEFADGTVDVADLLNGAPDGLKISNSSIAENSTPGTVVGTLSAGDANALDSHTYEIVDSGGNVVADPNFEIVGNEVRVKAGADLNYEATSSYDFNVRVTDAGGESYTELFTIDVTDVNEGPTVSGESYSTNEDSPVTENLLSNDSDVDGDALTVGSYTQPAHGNVTVDANGDFTYQPNANFSGSDSFTYTVSDGNGGTATETVSINVSAVADQANLDVTDANGDEDTAISLDVSALLVDTDGSETISDVTISGVPSGAVLSGGTDNGDGSWSLAPGNLDGLTVTPDANSNADFDLTVEVTTVDGADSATISDSIHVEVNAVNDAVNDIDLSGTLVAENSPAGTVVGTLSATDIDAGETFNYEIVDSGGIVVSDANFEIVGDEVRVRAGADLNYEATSSYDFNVRVTDAGGESYTELFTIDVTDVNEGPTVAGESYTTSEDRPVTGNLLSNDSDVDGDSLIVSSYSQPANGNVTVDANGDFTYQPNANFSGSDSFTYTVSDGNGRTATETVSIDVSAVADQADLDVNDASGDEDTAILLDVSALLVDTDGSETISDVTISGVPSGAVLSAGTDNGDGSWSLAPGNLDGLTVTPDANSNADFDLTVEVTTVDGADSATISDSIHVEVNAVNDAVNDIDLSGTLVAENSPAGTVVGTLSATDIDAVESFNYEIVDSGGNVVSDANFEIVGDEVRVKAGADLNYEVDASHVLDIRVTDAGGESHAETFTINVTNVNEGPTVSGESYSIDEDGTLSGNLLANDSDVDGDVLSISSYTQPASGSVLVDVNGDFVYEPADNYSGLDSFTYTVSDEYGENVTTTVNITINPVADAVSLTAGDAGGDEDSAIELNLGATLHDTDGSESISDIMISGVPSGAVLSAGIDNGDGSWSLAPADLDGLTITPNANSNADLDLTIKVTTVDGSDSATISDTLHVEVNSVNDAVSDVDLTGNSVAENSPAGTVVGVLSATDIDAGETFTYDIVDSDGKVVSNANFEIVGDAVRVKSGADLNYERDSSHDLNIRVTDSGGESHTELFTIDVSNVNEGPAVAGESYTTSEDRPVSGNLLSNDSDIDGDSLVVSSYTQPANGTVTVDTNGDFIYEPDANFSGSDSFTYTVSDGNGESVAEIVRIEVAAVTDGAEFHSDDVTGIHHTPIPLDIKVIFADHNERDNFGDITVTGVPDGVVLSNGADSENGIWTLALDDLDGLTLTSFRVDSISFELTVSGTVTDGNDSQTISDVISVKIIGEIVQPTDPDQPPGTDLAPSPLDDVTDTSAVQQVRGMEQIARSLDNLSFSVNEPETFAAFPSEVPQDPTVWQSDQWEQFESTFGTIDEVSGPANDSDDTTTAASEEMQVALAGLADAIPAPDALIGDEAIFVSNGELESLTVEIDGLPQLGEMSGGEHNAPLTAGALMLLITSKDENRRKIKKLSSASEENENQS